MKVIHYIPSIDRIAGGTSTYMQVLAKGLGELAEVHIITHASENPLPIENCMIHNVSGYNPLNGRFKKEMVGILDEVKPDIVHVNCCWMPACAAIQCIAQKRGLKVVLTPHAGTMDSKAALLDTQGASSDPVSESCGAEGRLHSIYRRKRA